MKVPEILLQRGPVMTVILFVFVIGIVISDIYFYLTLSRNGTPPPPPDVVTESVSTSTPIDSAQIDAEKTVPKGFPSEIPIEEGAKLEESYDLNYDGQRQLTIVFPSTKTVKENYALYEDFLLTKGWNISNKYTGKGVSALYGTKGDIDLSHDINITIIESVVGTSTKSQVSVSVLEIQPIIEEYVNENI